MRKEGTMALKIPTLNNLKNIVTPTQIEGD
jgi:hypothetical protein